MSTDAAPLVYTAEQAALRLGRDADGNPIKSARWLLDRAREGRIPYTRIGKTPCWSERDLLDLVEKGYIAPPNRAA